MPSFLEQSICNTIRYFSLFDMPVTAVQIWRALVLDQEDSRRRWGGRHLPSLREIQEVLRTSTWLQVRLNNQWGYFFLRGNEKSVRQRLARHILAQHKWRLTQKLVKWLAAVPCVRMIAGSGSLALSNTRPESDLDLFMIVRRGRIWTTRLLLLFVAQLLGRRRKHWDEQAPDRLCFNHFITDEDFVMPLAVRNLYTAVAYTHLSPLFGQDVLVEFQQANAPWLRNYLMYPDHIPLAPKQSIFLPYLLKFFRRSLEGILLEPIGDFIENWAEKIQRRVIEKHRKPGRLGRIAVSDQELAFHPDSRVPDILRQFAQDAGQKVLL